MSKLRLSGDVFFKPSVLFSLRNKTPDIFPFNAKKIYYFYLGRTAIWHGATALGLGKGDEILMPAYNCGTEVDPLLKFGLNLIYYNNDKQLNLQIEELEQKITAKTKVLYITHFFGFPQPLDDIKKFCREKNLFLFEDCAPSLFSFNKNESLGSFGDVSIFSFRKSLPLPDGSALVINNPEIKYTQPVMNNPWIYDKHDLLYLIKGNYVYSHNNSGLLKKVSSKIYNLRNHEITTNQKEYEIQQLGTEKITMLAKGGYFWPQIEAAFGMSGVTKKILYSVNPEIIISQRRSNFEYLSKRITEIPQLDSVFTELPKGVCPLVYPVIVDDREALRAAFQKKDIALGRWWRFYHKQVPWQDFPTAVRLKNHLVSIPIHQDVNEIILEKLIEELKLFYRNN